MADIDKLTTSYQNILGKLNHLSEATQIHCSIIDYFTNHPSCEDTAFIRGKVKSTSNNYYEFKLNISKSKKNMFKLEPEMIIFEEDRGKEIFRFPFQFTFSGLYFDDGEIFVTDVYKNYHIDQFDVDLFMGNRNANIGSYVFIIKDGNIENV